MNTQLQEGSFTFLVDDVPRATKPLGEGKLHVAIKRVLDSAVESCSDYHSDVVWDLNYHPLLAAVYKAFSDHRPLVLSPDVVWITIVQGVAQHLAIHGERLRDKLVAHQGKLDLTFNCDGWVEGSPENPWNEAFASWAQQIRQHVGEKLHDDLVCDFSTTGPVELAASRIVMMDVFQRYFHYVALCICGIPEVTLEGSVEDWDKLLAKARGLSIFDMEWWLTDLIPIGDHFARARRGDVDKDHWQRVCKLREEYGGDIINGWVARLFPYVREFVRGPCTRRNPIFDTGEGFSTLFAPSGLSRVPITWLDGVTGKRRSLEAIGGLVGVTQDPHTLALRPKAGWAIREAPVLDVLLDRLTNEHQTRPGVTLPSDANRESWEFSTFYPGDLCAFYDRTDGAELFVSKAGTAYRFVALKDVCSLDFSEPVELGCRGPDGKTWHRIAILADGSWLAINLDLNRRDPREGWDPDRIFNPVCHCRKKTVGKRGRNPVVAFSFTELLERLMEGGPIPYWFKSGFVSYGDAEDFTRRG